MAVGLGGCVAHGATSGRVVIKDENAKVDMVFSDHDRRLIQEYYRMESQKKHRTDKGVPPGLAKKGGVPPGLAKKGGLPPGLARRDRLPDDLEGEHLPRELEARLSRLPDTYVRVRVGQDFVLFDRRTRVVFDIAHGLGD
jgi:hypothetical protein